MQGLTWIIHLSFRQGGDWSFCCVVWCKKPLYKIQFIIIPIPLLQRIRQMMLPSACWQLSLFKCLSKYNTAPLRHKKKLFTWLVFQRWLEMYTFCAIVGSSHSHIAEYKLSIARLVTHLLENNLNKCEHMATCSSWFDLKTHNNSSCCKTVQFKVNGTNLYMAMVYLHIGLLQIYCRSYWLWCTGL
jgi:hypothetical protein